jgi:hypothetical protein
MMNSIKILVTNQKGGVGKSTIAANLAAFLGMQEGLKVSLIDFDKQASSSRWTKKAPDIGIAVHRGEVNYQSRGLALLSARASVRKFSHGVDVSIADITWTQAMPDEFMLDFDMILVPTSSAKFEMASTEIFILEYVQRHMARLAVNKQFILVAPSRVERSFSSNGILTNLDFLANCHITPPILNIPDIDQYVYEDFFCVSTNTEISNNFCQFGKFITQKIQERNEVRKSLSINGVSLNLNIMKKVTVLDAYRAKARNLGFYGGSAATPLESSELVEHSAAERFIPGFLKK